MKILLKIITILALVLMLAACPQATDGGGSGQPLIEMVTVKGGNFDYQNKTPTDVQNFLLGKYEVTQKEWKAVMGSEKLSSHSLDFGEGDDLPMYELSWNNAVEFCNTLSKKEDFEPVYYIDTDKNDGEYNHTVDTEVLITFGDSGPYIIANLAANGYRLPTEVEWEYAAGHGGYNEDGTVKPRAVYAAPITVDGEPDGIDDKSGEELQNYAWYEHDGYDIGERHENVFVVGTAGSESQVKGSGNPNGIGLYDMSGNVKELVYDWVYPGTFSQKVCRGGSFNSFVSSLGVLARVATFVHIGENTRNGFRVARNIQ